MKINTQKFGQIEISSDRVITLPDGMLGFADKKRYALIQQKDTAPFCLMQSLDDPYLGFFVIDPMLFLPDYFHELEHALKKTAFKAEEVSCFVVVTIPQGAPDKMSANLIGPVIIDNRTREAVQLVLENSPYSHQYPLLGNHPN